MSEDSCTAAAKIQKKCHNHQNKVKNRKTFSSNFDVESRVAVYRCSIILLPQGRPTSTAAPPKLILPRDEGRRREQNLQPNFHNTRPCLTNVMADTEQGDTPQEPQARIVTYCGGTSPNRAVTAPSQKQSTSREEI